MVIPIRLPVNFLHPVRWSQYYVGICHRVSCLSCVVAAAVVWYDQVVSQQGDQCPSEFNRFPDAWMRSSRLWSVWRRRLFPTSTARHRRPTASRCKWEATRHPNLCTKQCCHLSPTNQYKIFTLPAHKPTAQHIFYIYISQTPLRFDVNYNDYCIANFLTSVPANDFW